MSVRRTAHCFQDLALYSHRMIDTRVNMRGAQGCSCAHYCRLPQVSWILIHSLARKGEKSFLLDGHDAKGAACLQHDMVDLVEQVMGQEHRRQHSANNPIPLAALLGSNANWLYPCPRKHQEPWKLHRTSQVAGTSSAVLHMIRSQGLQGRLPQLLRWPSTTGSLLHEQLQIVALKSDP